MPTTDPLFLGDEPSPPPQDGGDRGGGRSRATLLTAVGTVVVGTLVAAGLFVVKDRHDDAARQRAHERLVAQQRAYLAGVADVHESLNRHVAPVRKVLAALIEPHPGDIYAVRDALATEANERAVSHDIASLEKLTPPAPWVGHDTELRRALNDVRAALRHMRERRGVDDFRQLNRGFQSHDGPELGAGMNHWREAVRHVFVAGHLTVPGVFAGARPPVPSMTGWVFAAERACISANIAYQRLASRIKSPGIDWQAFRDVGELMQRTGTRLRDLDVPRGAPDSFHGDVVVRLRTMNALGDAAVDLADAFLASDRLGVGTAADRVETLQESGDRLATGFREYHVLACAGLIGGRLGDDNPVKT